MEHKFKADEIFDLIVDTNAVFPLNLDFVVKDKKSQDFSGPGIYFLYYKEELVYIGYFHSSKLINDVRTQRWIKELASITMRGKHIVFTQSAFTDHQNCVNYPVFQGEISDNGFLTSVNRVRFADENWNSFQTNDFLGDFTFYWFKEEKNLNRTREELEKVTNQLREFYKPTCNGQLQKTI
jgi:hypothetical protein